MEQEEHTATKKIKAWKPWIQGLVLAWQCIILTTNCLVLPCCCGHNKAIFKVAPLSLCIILKQTYHMQWMLFQNPCRTFGRKVSLGLGLIFQETCLQRFFTSPCKCIMVMLCSLFCIIVLFQFEVPLLHTSSIWLKLAASISKTSNFPYYFFHRMN